MYNFTRINFPVRLFLKENKQGYGYFFGLIRFIGTGGYANVDYKIGIGYNFSDHFVGGLGESNNGIQIKHKGKNGLLLNYYRRYNSCLKLEEKSSVSVLLLKKEGMGTVILLEQ